jgi:hypothetical protein
MVDSTFLLGAYIGSSNMPAKLLVRASDMTTVEILVNGYEEAAFRATLDRHLANLP